MLCMVTLAALLWISKLANSQWTLKNGTKVSFVFFQSGTNQAWRPDGSLANSGVLLKNLPPGYFDKNETPVLVAWINPSAPKMKDEPTFRFKLPTTGLLDSAITWLALDSVHWVGGCLTPVGQPSRQDVAVGVGTGPWDLASWVSYGAYTKSVQPLKHQGIEFKPKIEELPARIKQLAKTPFILVSDPALENLVGSVARFAVFDQKGKQMQSAGSVKDPAPNAPVKFCFIGDIRDVGRVELWTRRMEWHTILAAHFKPN